MFNKSEEAEWTRFSRALGKRDQPREADDVSQVAEPDELDAEPTMVAPPTPVQPPAPEPEPVAAEVTVEARYPEPVAAPPPPPPPAPVVAPPSAPVAPPPPPPAPVAVRPSAPPSTARPVAIAADETTQRDESPSDEDESVVGDGTEVEGALRSRHSLRILGSVQGEIECREGVTVETDATVNAKIVAENIIIKGVVNGDLTCPGRIEITDSGRLIGSISGGILVMHEGAYFEGSLKMSARRNQRDPEADSGPDLQAAQGNDPLTERQL